MGVHIRRAPSSSTACSVVHRLSWVRNFLPVLRLAVPRPTVQHRTTTFSLRLDDIPLFLPSKFNENKPRGCVEPHTTLITSSSSKLVEFIIPPIVTTLIKIRDSTYSKRYKGIPPYTDPSLQTMNEREDPKDLYQNPWPLPPSCWPDIPNSQQCIIEPPKPISRSLTPRYSQKPLTLTQHPPHIRPLHTATRYSLMPFSPTPDTPAPIKPFARTPLHPQALPPFQLPFEPQTFLPLLPQIPLRSLGRQRCSRLFSL